MRCRGCRTALWCQKGRGRSAHLLLFARHHRHRAEIVDRQHVRLHRELGRVAAAAVEVSLRADLIAVHDPVLSEGGVELGPGRAVGPQQAFYGELGVERCPLGRLDPPELRPRAEPQPGPGSRSGRITIMIP